MPNAWKSKKSVPVTATPGSPSARAQELEEVDVADEQPEQQVAATGTKKKTPKRASGRGGAIAKPPKKKKKQQPEPETEPEPEPEPAEGEGFDLDEVRSAVKAFRFEHRRKPTAEELAEGMEVDEAVAATALKKLKKEEERRTNQKKAQRVKGYRKLSRAAGYGYDKEGSTNVISQGVDSLQSLISMHDALRLVQFVPFTPDGVSYTELEFKERIQGLLATLPQSAARQVVANADSVLRFAVNKAVSDTMMQRTAQRVQPSTMVAVLEPYAERMSFSSVLAPPGLVKYMKDEPPPLRKDYADTDTVDKNGKKLNKEFEAAIKEYKKRVPFADRGLGLVELGDEDAEDADKERIDEEKKLAVENSKVAKKNASALAKLRGDIDKAKKQRKDALATHKANMARAGTAA
jgi:hypothetical protein